MEASKDAMTDSTSFHQMEELHSPPSTTTTSSACNCTADEDDDDTYHAQSQDDELYQEEFNHYIDEYIQDEIDGDIQRQLDKQMEEEDKRLDALMQRRLDDAIARDAERFHIDTRKNDRNDGTYDNDLGELFDGFNVSSFRLGRAMKKTPAGSTGVTVGDIHEAIQKAVDAYSEKEQ